LSGRDEYGRRIETWLHGEGLFDRRWHQDVAADRDAIQTQAARIGIRRRLAVHREMQAVGIGTAIRAPHDINRRQAGQQGDKKNRLESLHVVETDILLAGLRPVAPVTRSESSGAELGCGRVAG